MTKAKWITITSISTINDWGNSSKSQRPIFNGFNSIQHCYGGELLDWGPLRHIVRGHLQWTSRQWLCLQVCSTSFFIQHCWVMDLVCFLCYIVCTLNFKHEPVVLEMIWNWSKSPIWNMLWGSTNDIS